MPRSVFLGRTVRAGEPLWTDEDRDWALALLAFEADRCDCGQPRSESMAPESEGLYRGSALRCHACKAIADASERWADDPAGLFINIRKLTIPR